MADGRQEQTRHLIVNSLFRKQVEDPKNPGYAILYENLLAHVKVYEDASAHTQQGKSRLRPSKVETKCRYLLLAERYDGAFHLYKSRKFENKFSIGQSWPLEQLRAVEGVNPTTFVVTLNKAYCWSTETPYEKQAFLYSLVQVYRKFTTQLPRLASCEDFWIEEQTQSDEFVMALSLQEKLANANSTTSIRSFDSGLRNLAKNDRSTPSLFAGANASESNSIMNYAIDEDVKQEEISLANVEELLKDFDWKEAGNAAALEERLLDELAALESANIHAMVESDDRLNSVIRQLDKAISELDNMDSMLTLYTTELNSMGDEIHHIESQNRGLQVETANQKALLADLERLINLITISDQVLQTLLGESLNTIHGVQKIEEAADILQKALLTSYDESTRGMAAVKEKMGLYTQYSNQFCLNFCEFMKQAIKYQADNLISDKTREPRRDSMTILGHEKMEEVLLRYMSLSLWLKEIDPRKHNELQLAYVVSAEQIYRKETKEYLTQIRSMLSKREISEEATYAFSAALIQGHHRSSLIYGSADHGRAPWEFKDSGRGKLPPEEAFEQILLTLVPLIVHEQNFISDFFHIGSKGPKSFQDRAELASWHPKELNGTREVIKDVKAQRKLLEHMEKIFGFLPEELSSFIEYGCKHDNIQCVGMIARIEKYIKEYEKTSQEFFVKVMKQARAQCITIFERFMVEQLKAIEDTKVTTKKRKGIVLFIRIFPRFCERIEHSMAGVASLEIRDIVNRAYETLVKTMFDSLEAIARDVSSINDDKEQLNVHIMILENMHHFHNEIRMRKILVLDPYTVYAKSSYEKHLEAYARKVLQKPFSKLIEFFDGIDNLLKTSAPEEVGFHMRYSKESLKKLTEHYTAREIKKGLEQLYKRVEKHFTEEEGLLRVVWGIIGQVVIDNHKHFIDLINRCYPDSNIKLEYSLSDLQNFIKVVHEGRKS